MLRAGRTRDLAESVSCLGEQVTRNGWTVSVAESVTGGSVAQALVAEPGSGDWFAGGVVAYMSRVKRSVLDVRVDHVVSAEAARQMARGVTELLRTDVGIATTGCAGPETMDGEPVGSTWIGVAVLGHAIARHFQFDGDTETIRRRAVVEAVELANQQLNEQARL